MRDPARSNREHTRGGISNAWFREALTPRAGEALPRRRSPEQQVVREYLNYQAGRMLRQHLLAAATDITSLRQLLEEIVKRMLLALPSSAARAAQASKPACCELDLREEYGKGSDGLVLGKCGFGGNSALGSVSSETVPVLLVTLTLGLAEIQFFHEHIWLVEDLLDLIDRVVPIQMDWRLRLRACPSERPFMLGRNQLGIASELVCSFKRDNPGEYCKETRA